ncbi:hypothetical protein [Chondrinema litorale]|uniref:hypothetical protein n=1 Tax=Chondrinema litorale TaxID=2994555 RepID=UPI002543ED7F|nr:hypothetical protein [Chondrinema litorale]UZR95005.1 hypothetical protein OQ292_04145 [Chondrinema litorale]
MRFWSISVWYDGGTFLKLNFDKQGNWQYARGFVYEDSLVCSSQICDFVDIESLWEKLLDLDVLTLSDMHQSDFSIITDKCIYHVGEGQIDRFISADPSSYWIELYSKNKYRSYYYINSESLLTSYQKSKNVWYMPDLINFVKITQTLRDTFYLNDIHSEFAAYVRNKRSLVNATTKKRKKRRKKN